MANVIYTGIGFEPQFIFKMAQLIMFTVNFGSKKFYEVNHWITGIIF